jgi:hypothetical protein
MGSALVRLRFAEVGVSIMSLRDWQSEGKRVRLVEMDGMHLAFSTSPQGSEPREYEG